MLKFKSWDLLPNYNAQYYFRKLLLSDGGASCSEDRDDRYVAFTCTRINSKVQWIWKYWTGVNTITSSSLLFFIFDHEQIGFFFCMQKSAGFFFVVFCKKQSWKKYGPGKSSIHEKICAYFYHRIELKLKLLPSSYSSYYAFAKHEHALNFKIKPWYREYAERPMMKLENQHGRRPTKGKYTCAGHHERSECRMVSKTRVAIRRLVPNKDHTKLLRTNNIP